MRTTITTTPTNPPFGGRRAAPEEIVKGGRVDVS
jgi:hypothetical protein